MDKLPLSTCDAIYTAVKMLQGVPVTQGDIDAATETLRLMLRKRLANMPLPFIIDDLIFNGGPTAHIQAVEEAIKARTV